MGFDDLLCRKIEQGTFEQFEKYSKELLAADPKYGEVFLYALALADHVSQSYFKDKIMLLGGFGVLGHMVSVEGPEIVKYWRGSHDLDMACQNSEAVAFVLRHLASEDSQSLSLPDKKKARFYDGLIEEMSGKASICEADIYYPSDTRDPKKIRVGNKILREDDFKGAEEVSVYDISLKIYDKHGLLVMKLGVVTSENLPRPKDITDIYNLLGVCERQGSNAEAVFARFNDKEKGELMEVFLHAPPIGNRSILVPPSVNFLNDLLRLHQEETSS